MLQEGGWTILATDAKIMTHPKFGGLWDDWEELLLLASDAGASVMTDMQRVTGQPREASDQATWLAAGYTRDRGRGEPPPRDDGAGPRGDARGGRSLGQNCRTAS